MTFSLQMPKTFNVSDWSLEITVFYREMEHTRQPTGSDVMLNLFYITACVLTSHYSYTVFLIITRMRFNAIIHSTVMFILPEYVWAVFVPS